MTDTVRFALYAVCVALGIRIGGFFGGMQVGAVACVALLRVGMLIGDRHERALKAQQLPKKEG